MSTKFESLRHHRDLRALARRSHQTVVLAACTGALTGLVVAVFDRIVVDVALERLLEAPLWFVGLMPGIGLLAALGLRHLIDPSAGTGTADEYLHAFHDQHHDLRWRPLVARMAAALATLGSGNPLGLEGPSLYAGATIGNRLQHHFPRFFRTSERNVLLVAGAAAGVAAIFKAPATGAVFAMEVPYQGDLARRMLLPALVASGSGYLVFVAINDTAALFPIEGNARITMTDLLGAAAVGVIAGIGARAFASVLRAAKTVASRPRPMLPTIAAGVILGGLFALGRLLTGESLLITSGYNVIAWAAEPGRTVPILLSILVLRSIATAISVAGGGVGGLFIPLVVGGALIGSAIGTIADPSNLTLFIVIGVAAFLGAGYRVPLAAVMFVAETTGRPSFIVPGLFAAVAAELVMGNASITKYQRRPADSPISAHQ